jgi:hypothetical protein
MEEKKLLKVMYKGKLPIGGIELDCAVLDDETRILSTTSVFLALGRTTRGLHKNRNKQYLEELNKINPFHSLRQIPPFLSSKSIISLINKDFLLALKPIEYQDNNKICYGYQANILPEICSLYLEARRKKILSPSQKKFAIQSEILLESFAKVGITALIDEATGFQYNRKYDALRFLLQQYINDGISKWLKRFPDKFFEELDKLYKNEKTTSRKRPQYYGKFINEYIYNPIEKGYVKEELNKKNIKNNGKRISQFHRWLTDFGANQLAIQIGRVMGVMEISTSIRKFKDRIGRQKALQIQPELFDLED